MKTIRLLQSIGRDHIWLEAGTELSLPQADAERLILARIAEWSGPQPYQTAVIEPQETRVTRGPGRPRRSP
jgi:hypothetical protein